MRDIQTKREPMARLWCQHPPFLTRLCSRLTPAWLDHVVRQAGGEQTTRESCVPAGDGPIDHGVVRGVRLESVHAAHRTRRSRRRERHRDPCADATQVPCPMGVALAQALTTARAHVPHHQRVGLRVRHDRQRPAVIRRLAIAEVPLQQRMGHPLREPSDVHRRVAGTAARALQGRGELCLEAARRAVCEPPPPTRRQRADRESLADGLTLLTEGELAPLLHSAHSVGGHPLVQGVRGHLGLRMAIASEVTAPSSGDGGVFDPFRRHQLHTIRAGQWAARAWDTRALTRQGCSVLGRKHRGELPFDFPGRAFHLLFPLHRDFLEGDVMGTIHLEGMSL